MTDALILESEEAIATFSVLSSVVVVLSEKFKHVPCRLIKLSNDLNTVKGNDNGILKQRGIPLLAK